MPRRAPHRFVVSISFRFLATDDGRINACIPVLLLERLQIQSCNESNISFSLFASSITSPATNRPFLPRSIQFNSIHLHTPPSLIRSFIKTYCLYHLAMRRLRLTPLKFSPIGTGKPRSLYHCTISLHFSSSAAQDGLGSFCVV